MTLNLLAILMISLSLAALSLVVWVCIDIRARYRSHPDRRFD